MSTPTLDIIIHAIRRVLGDLLSEVTAESAFEEDLRLDSLDLVDLLLDVEHHAGVAVPDDILRDLRTVGDLARYIDHVKGSPAS